MQILQQVAFIFRHEKRGRLAILVLVGAIVASMEIIGALLVFGLLDLVASPTPDLDVPFVGWLPDLFPGLTREGTFAVVAATVAIFFALRGFAIVGQSYVQMRVVHNSGARLAGRLIDGYLRMPYVWHVRRNTSELLRNTFYATQTLIEQTLLPLVIVGSELLVVTAMLILLLVLAPVETLVAAGIMIPIVFLLTRIVQPKLSRLGQAFQAASARSLQAFQQAIGALREVRLLAREDYFREVFMVHRRRFAHAHYMNGTIQHVPRATIESTLVIIIAALFLIAVFAGDDIDGLLARLGLFAYAGMRLQPSLQKVMRGLQDVRYSSAAVADVAADLEQFDRATKGRSVRPGAVGPLRESVELRSVSFAYQPGAEPALRDIDLTVRRGEILGICGPTGGGKSTLVDVIAGLLTPTSGQVLVDGVDLTLDPAGWYEQLGVVSQTVVLIDDTLRKNVALGVDDDAIDLARLERAIGKAQLNETVASLPDGIDTVVGERGVRLSGGQRQRVAVARALYREPAVIIFDEGTSALDNLTEAQLIEQLVHADGQPTVIMVAHRLTTVRDADRILVVEAGRIAADGTFDELLSRNATFRSLAT